MGNKNFMGMLETRWANGHFVCVGLDSAFNKISVSAHVGGNECDVDIANTIVAFNRAIVEKTQDLVCAYKPNTAFYEAYGVEGIAALQRSISDIHAIAPDVPVILDAKRADIGNTNYGYAQFAFNFLRADAITVHPYLGAEALEPFLAQKDKGIFVLCRTSNPGSGEFQDINVSMGPVIVNNNPSSLPFYQVVARHVANQWNKNGNCALVVGATYPSELHCVRDMVGDMPILIPGIGAQGGDLENTVHAGEDNYGGGIIINSSRAIIFASNGPDFAEAARRETERLHDAINHFRAV